MLMKVFMDKGVKFRSAYDDAHEKAQKEQLVIEAQRNRMILQDASEVVKSGIKLASTLTESSDEKKFLIKLIDYFQTRIKKVSSSHDHVVIAHRAKIVSACIDAIRNKDLAAITALLEEKNIKQIKGIFSSRMYNILGAFRHYPQERAEQVAQSLSFIPNELVEIITSYDSIFSNDDLDDDKENQRPQQSNFCNSVFR